MPNEEAEQPDNIEPEQLPLPKEDVVPRAVLAAALMDAKNRRDEARLINERLMANAAFINALKPYAHYRILPSPGSLGLGLVMRDHTDFAQNMQNAMTGWALMNQAMLEAQNRRREAMAAPAAMALRAAALRDALGGRGNFEAVMQRLFG